jgi:putative lipoic acid-binding regulatory protein
MPRRPRGRVAERARNRPSLLDFPCYFPLKAIGSGAEDFEALVLEITRKHVPGLDPGAATSRPSAGGNYLAVTVTFVAESQAQLDALYVELGQQPRVKMLL